MHWTRVSLLSLCATAILALSQTVSAQVTDDTSGVVRLDDFSGSMSLSGDGGSYFLFNRWSGDGVGVQGGYSTLGVRAKLLDLGESHLFTEINGLISDHSRLGASLGGGWRGMFDGAMVGAHGWYDHYESENGNKYSQGVVGLEYLHRWLDMRVNGYMPFGDRENFVRVLDPGTTPTFFGNDFGTVGVGQFERSLSGVDFEGGVPIPRAEFIRIFGGGYFLKAEGDGTWGVRSRVDARVGEGVNLGFVVTDDERFGTNLNFNATLWFGPGVRTTRFMKDMSGWSRRYDPVRRANFVQLALDKDDVNVPLVNAETGQRFHITWVDNTNASPGDGTFENPFRELPSAAADASHILVRAGVGSTVGNITLADNQHFWGEGREYVLRTTRIGNVTIPDQFFKQTGPRPDLFPFLGTKPTVTLANNNDVINFNIVGGSGGGIFGQNVRDFHLEALNIDAANGINISNADGLGILRNIQVASSGAGNGVYVGNTGGGRLDLDIDDLDVTGGTNGVHIFSDQSVVQASINGLTTDDATGTGLILNQFQGFLFANVQDAHVLSSGGIANRGMELRSVGGGQLGVNMQNVSARGTGDLLTINANTATVTANVTDGNFSQSTAGSGVVINASNALVTADFEELAASNNAVDGLRIAAAVGSQVNVSVIDSVLNSNVDNNFDVTAASGADVNLFVDPTLARQSGSHAFEFFVTGAGSTLDATFLDTDLSDAGGSAISGIVDHGGRARLDLVDVIASDATLNGLEVEVSDQSLFQALVRNSTFARSGVNGLDVDVTNGSAAFLDLVDADINDNGERGFQFEVTDGAAGASLLTANITNANLSNNSLNHVAGTVAGGSLANLRFQDVVADNDASLSGVNLQAATGGWINVDWSGAASSISNSDSNGVALLVNGVGSGINFNFADGAIDDNTVDGIDARLIGGGLGSRLNVVLNDASVANNGFNGIDYEIAGTNAIGRVEFNNTAVTGNGRDGLELNVTGGALVTVVGDNANLSDNGQRGIEATVDGAGSVATIDLPGATIDDSGLEGVLLTASNAGSLRATLNDASVTGSGNENIRGQAITGGTLDVNAAGSDFSGGGLNGNFDNVRIESTGAGSTALASLDGVNMDGGTRNGLLLSATDQASLIARLRSDAGVLSASGNPGAGVRIIGTDATNLIILSQGENQFNNNGGDGADVDVQSTDVAVISLSGSFDGNGGDGVNVAMTGVTTGAISIVGPGSASGNAGNGVDVDVTNSTLADVNVNGQIIPGLRIDGLDVAGNGDDAILVNFDDVDLFGTGEIANNNITGQPNGIVANLTNNSNANLNIHDNTVSDVANLGIVVTADSGVHNLTVGNNTVSRSGGHNIVVDLQGTAIAGQLHIDDNTVTGDAAAGDGIRLLVADNAGIASGTINNNASSNNGGFGVNVDVTGAAIVQDLRIDENTLDSNTAGGIRYNGAAGTALGMLSTSGNVVSSSGGTAIDVQLNNVAGAPDLAINDNNISNSAGLGINVQATDTSIEDVALNNNAVTGSAGGDGIRFEMTGAAATLNRIVGSGNTISQNAGTGLNILLDGLDTSGIRPSIDLTGNNVAENQGLGISITALDMSVNNVVIRNSTVTDNTGGDGIFINLDNQSGFARTANRIEVLGTTSSGNSGNGISVLANNMNVLSNFGVDSSLVTDNTGAGIVYFATNSPTRDIFITGTNVGNNQGGDGVLLSLIDSGVTGTVDFSRNGIDGNGANGFNLDANNSAIGALNIAGNSGGTTTNIGLGFLIDGNTFPIAGIPAWSIVNSSDPGILLTGFDFDIAPAGRLYNTETGANFPFTPELGSDVITGLATVNGVAVPPYPDGLVPDFSTLLSLAFTDFQPGETFSWNIDADVTPGGDEGVSGDQLIGSTITVNFSGGLFLSGALVAVPGNPDASQFVATGGNAFARGVANNADSGIRIALANGSNVGAINIDENVIDANGLHGVVFEVADSTLPTAGAPITITNNSITDHDGGDGIRMVFPDTNGTAIGLDLRGNTISNNTGGNGVNIELNSNAGGMATNITENVVNGNGQNGLKFNVTEAAVLDIADFSGNTVNGNVAGMGLRIDANQTAQVSLDAGATTADVGANTISGNRDAGIGIRLLNSAQANVTVTDTTISNTLDGADANFNGDGLRVVLNDTASLNSLTVGNGAPGIKDSHFDGNAGSGISLQLGVQSRVVDPLIRSSTFNGNGDDGIEIVRFGNAKIDNIRITDNEFNNNAGDGIEFQFQGGNVDIDTLGLLTIDAEIDNNNFSQNGGNGILLSLDADVNHAANIHNNVVNQSGVDAIQLRGEFDSVFNGMFSDNVLTNSGRDGVNVTLTERARAGLTIEDSQITGSVRDGIRVQTGNTELVGGVPLASILIRNNEPFFAGDTRGILNNGGSGINLLASSVSAQIIQIDDNRIGQNGVDGISMTVSDNAAMAVSATNNLILENAQHGVNMNTSGFGFLANTLTDNTILRNTRRGVSLVNTGNADTNLTITGTVNPVPSQGTNATSRIDQNGEVGIYVENNAGALNTSNNIELVVNNTAIVGNGTNTGVSSDDRNGLWIRVGTSSFGHVNADVDQNFFSGNGNVDFVTQSFTATPDPGVASQYTNPGAHQLDPVARLGLSLTNNRGDEIDVTRFGAFYENADPFKSPLAFFDSDARRRNAQRFTDSNFAPFPIADTITDDPGANATSFNGTGAGVGSMPNLTFQGLGVNVGGALRDITGYALGTSTFTVAPAIAPDLGPGSPFNVVATNISGVGTSTFRSRFNSVNAGGNVWGNVITDFSTQVFLLDGPGGNPDDDFRNQTFTWDFPFGNPFY